MAGPHHTLRIAFYMTTVLEYGGGLEKYLIETAAHLAGTEGVTADVITMDDRYTVRIVNLLSRFYGKPIDIKLSFKLAPADIAARLAPARYIKAQSFADLRRLLRQYDVVYSKNELLEAALFKFVIGYRRVPPVVFGGHTPLRYPIAPSWQAKLHNLLYTGPAYRWLAGGVHSFQALNAAERDLYRRSFPRRPVHFIYNPFDAEAYRERAEQAAAVLERVPGRTNVLWAGRLTEQKGVDLLAGLIDATQPTLGPDVHWHIAGDGEERPAIEQLAARHPNVTFYGHVEPAAMPGLYRDADIFVCTSRWEGYPYALLEARALGLPVVALGIPGATDILDGYANGRLAADPDSLRAALEQLVSAAPPRAWPSEDAFAPQLIYTQLAQALGDTT